MALLTVPPARSEAGTAAPPSTRAVAAAPAARSAAGPAVMLEPARAHEVTPHVREFAVSAGSGGPGAARTPPEPVHGFGVVGVTWAPGPTLGLRMAVRTRTSGTWSSWTRLQRECPCVAGPAGDPSGHGPDPGTAEARQARPGTDPVVVGDVDAVQLRATSPDGDVPRGLRLSVVNPGRSAADDDPAVFAGVAGPSAPTSVPTGVAARAVPARPRIRTRAAWGANERLRTRRPTFGVVRAGFVHHTVNSNGYSRADVPAIIRGIYAFHVLSNGWSDIGYNFLVDRFGRIWEGRFGGPARNVIGAHTFGYNHLSFAMSAIGNFQTARPPLRMLRAYGRLMAWKLALNGVRAGSLRQRLRGRTLRAVSGHRDAGQTLCPGINLYRRIPTIRRIAVRLQQGVPPPAPEPVPTPVPPPPPPDGG